MGRSLCNVRRYTQAPGLSPAFPLHSFHVTDSTTKTLYSIRPYRMRTWNCIYQRTLFHRGALTTWTGKHAVVSGRENVFQRVTFKFATRWVEFSSRCLVSWILGHGTCTCEGSLTLNLPFSKLSTLADPISGCGMSGSEILVALFVLPSVVVVDGIVQQETGDAQRRLVVVVHDCTSFIHLLHTVRGNQMRRVLRRWLVRSRCWLVKVIPQAIRLSRWRSL